MAAKILIVDDTREIVELLEDILGDEGYETVSAYNGQEALEQFEHHRPDMVILDVLLPKVNGLEVLRRIRSTPEAGQIPVMMMTAVYKDERFSRNVILNFGAAAYIKKPFDHDEVVSTVARLLSGTEPISVQSSDVVEETVAAPLAPEEDVAEPATYEPPPLIEPPPTTDAAAAAPTALETGDAIEVQEPSPRNIEEALQTLLSDEAQEEIRKRSEAAEPREPTILLVEDQPIVRNALGAALERAGYRVISAEDGMEALRQIRSEELDLIISDLMMPGLDGQALCQTVKKSPQLNHIPFVILTSKKLSRDGGDSFRVGADFYVEKPVDRDRLLKIVETFLPR